jgi:hypothetical protein
MHHVPSREITAQAIFEATLSPSSFQILLALGRVALVHKLKWPAFLR